MHALVYWDGLWCVLIGEVSMDVILNEHAT